MDPLNLLLLTPPYMSQYINRAQVLGNITLDPLVKDNVTIFTLATNHTYNKPDGELVSEAEYHYCVAFGTLGKLMAHYKKWQFILIEWRIQTRSWNDNDSGEKKYKKEIIADNIVLLGDMK